MAIKAFVSEEEFEQIPESIRDFYVEEETEHGKRYRLDAEDVEDVSGLKSALQKEREERRKAKELLQKYSDIDPEEYARLREEAEKREREKAEKEGNFEKIKEQMLEKHRREIEERENQVQAMRQRLERYLVDAEATRAISEAKGVPKLLLPYVKAHVKVVEENGEFVVRVVDENGNPRVGDTQGNPMTIAQYIAELREDPEFGRAFEASGASGSGAPANGKGSGSLPKRKSEMTAKEKAQYISKHGADAFHALPD